MKHQPDHDRLLDDMVEDALPPGLRASLLDQTLAAVRVRRRIRLFARAAGAGAVVCLGLALWRFPSARFVPVAPRAPLTVDLPPSSPLQILHTDGGSVILIDSAADSVQYITDASCAEPIHVLDDEELLSLLAGRPAALVRTASGRAELVFADPTDAKGFPVRQSEGRRQ
jgi:hypothetical protein